MQKKMPPFPLPHAPHAISLEKLFSALRTSEVGLSSEEASQRIASFGKNQIEEEKIPAYKIFLRQFKNILIYILIAASMISLLLREWTDFLVIFSVILLNTLLGFWQEMKAEHSIRALRKLTENKARVNRDGKIKLLFSSELVPGDCVFLKEGEVVTADLRLIEGTALLVDESTMTGESVPIGKDSTKILSESTQIYDLKNMALAGTLIVRGDAKAIVVRTGQQTYFGQIAQKAKEPVSETHLMKAIKKFASWLVLSFVLLFGLFFVVGLFQGRPLGELAYILVACLVSAVPEGLPLVITLVVVIGAIILSKKKTYVRVLPSVEALGSATVIACDKTGTITEGKLIVKEWVAQDFYKLQLIAGLCNDASQGLGDPLDLALWNWVGREEKWKESFMLEWSYPFDARNMLMAKVYKIDNQQMLLVKGAYESLKKLSDKNEGYDRDFHQLLEKGYRVLAFGMGEWKKNTNPLSWKIEIVGLVGFLDPPKAEVKEAVAKAKKAHIRVLMLTGDHLMTARSVAKEVGIWKEGDRILIGSEIESMNEDELQVALKQASVAARILPEHKYKIVKGLRERGEVVAVTGDGVNDVPALKVADLGIAMGSGDEAAKSVSEMIITDNNFNVIVEAIKRGRVITDNIRKVIYYLLSTSLQEIFLIAFSLFAFLPIPLTAVQILWINLVTDGVQDQFFAFIKEENDVMKQYPKKAVEKFVDVKQALRILIFGLGMGSVIFILYFFLREKYPPQLLYSIIFTSTVTAQWANGIQAQKESEPFFKNIRRSFSINPWIFLGVGAGFVLQLSAIYLFPASFKIAPLSLLDWIYPMFTFLVAFAFVEIRKWIEYSNDKDKTSQWMIKI